MGNYIIKPNPNIYSGVWDNAFLWKEENVYVMASHRLALWCWLQAGDILKGDYSLIHIDKHTDARRCEGEHEPECVQRFVSEVATMNDYNTYESLQCPCVVNLNPPRSTRPCITWDNFVHLAAKAEIFKNYFLYSSEGDWPNFLPESSKHFYRELLDVRNLESAIKQSAGKCIVDIDLDFFDDDWEDFPEGVSETGLLGEVLKIVTKNREFISMITIAINDTPGAGHWEKRQEQLAMVNEALGMNIPIPVI